MTPLGPREVALKVSREDVPEEEKVKLLQEAAIMKQFCHPNVVRLLGTVTISDPVSSACTPHAHTHTHARTHVRTHARTHAHTHTHTHIHTEYMRTQKWIGTYEHTLPPTSFTAGSYCGALEEWFVDLISDRIASRVRNWMKNYCMNKCIQSFLFTCLYWPKDE